MLVRKKIMIVLIGILLATVSLAQHPDLKKIDSLKKMLPKKQGIERIDCLNAIGIEYWWPSLTAGDTISGLANLAYKEATAINYSSGKATSTMLLGVAEIFKQHFNIAEKYLRQALSMFETLKSDYGLGWCNVWLGQSLYSQNKFEEGLTYDKTSVFYLKKLDDWEGQGKAWAWIGMTYRTLGNYDSSFYYCSKSLALQQKMSDHVCVVISYINMGELYKAAGSYEDALHYYNQGFQYANTHNTNNFRVSWTYFEVVGTIYRLINLPDTSYYFLRKSLHVDSTNETTLISFGETLLLKNEYDSALKIFLKPIEGFRNGNDKWDLMRALMDAAKTYLKTGEIKKALSYALEAYSIAKLSGAKQLLLEGNLVLSKIYSALRINDSAYFFLE